MIKKPKQDVMSNLELTKAVKQLVDIQETNNKLIESLITTINMLAIATGCKK